MDPPMWASYDNNRFGEFPMQLTSTTPVSQPNIPMPGYGGPGMIPVENVNSPYMMSPYDSFINKSVANSQADISKPNLNMHSTISPVGGGVPNHPLWSPLASGVNSQVPVQNSVSKSGFPQDLQYSQISRVSPLPQGGFPPQVNSAQVNPCSPHSPMIQRSQTPTDLSNNSLPRNYPGTPSPNSQPQAIPATMPEQYNHAKGIAEGPQIKSAYSGFQPPQQSQQIFTPTTNSQMSSEKASYPSVIAHSGSSQNQIPQELSNIELELFNESLEKPREVARKHVPIPREEVPVPREEIPVPREEVPVAREEVNKPLDESEQNISKGSEDEVKDEPGSATSCQINPTDPALQPVVKLKHLTPEKIKQLSEVESMVIEPEFPNNIESDDEKKDIPKVVFLEIEQELRDISLTNVMPSVKFNKKDSGFMKSFLRFIRCEKEPLVMAPTKTFVKRYEPPTKTRPTPKPAKVETEKKQEAIKETVSRAAVAKKRRRDSDEEELHKPDRKISREESRRRSSRRLRTKSSISYRSIEYNSEEEDDDFVVEPPTVDAHANEDPAWIPGERADDEVEEIGESDEKSNRRRNKPPQTISRPSKKTTEEQNTVVVPKSTVPETYTENKDLFKTGDFVVLRSDLISQENPPIWRVDGKSLLQKYGTIQKDGKLRYQNISTYAGYTSQTVSSYVKINVKINNFSRNEIVVEWLKDKRTKEEEEALLMTSGTVSETNPYQESFEIYIQTLISQGLDPNFLTEIYAERDDYFVSNMEKIDALTEEKRMKLLGLLGWKGDKLIKSLGSWPCVNIAKKKGGETSECGGCEINPSAKLVLLYGQTYDPVTLGHCQPDPELQDSKNWKMCEECANLVELYSQLAHQKYNYYLKCASRVANKRKEDPEKDTTVILNELLADDPWLNQLFREAQTSWCRVDVLEKKKKL